MVFYFKKSSFANVTLLLFVSLRPGVRFYQKQGNECKLHCNQPVDAIYFCGGSVEDTTFSGEINFIWSFLVSIKTRF